MIFDTQRATVFRALWADEDLHLIIDDEDVTYWGGVATEFGGYTYQEPFTFGGADFSFPQIPSTELRTKNTGDLKWLNDQKPAKLVKVNNGQRVGVVWRGIVTSRAAQDNHVVIHCDGDAAGRFALAIERPSLHWRRKDVGELVWHSFKLANIPFTPRFGPTTGIKLDNQGADGPALDFVTENLSLAQELGGTQWTCGVVDLDKRKYHMYRKDMSTVHCTVDLRGEGVEHDFTDDLSEKHNRVWGRGEVKGHKWLNIVRPLMHRSAAPAFDMPAGQVMKVGTTNADTLSGEGITALHNRLLNTGDIHREDFGSGTFEDDTADAVQSVQRQAELPQTGKVDPDTWDAIWDVRVTGKSLKGSEIIPLAQLSRVKEWLRTATGAIFKRNPNWDPDAVPVDLMVEFPPGVRKARARKWARHKVDQADDPNWVGTLTLNGADVFQGDVTDTTANPTPISRLDIREGWNIKVLNWDGASTLFHISAVNVTADKQVRLLVDTKARDAMTLAEIRQRNQDNKRNPNRTKRLGSGNKNIPWAEGSGTLDGARSLTAGQWNKLEIPAGGEGRIRKLHIELTANCEFSYLILGDKASEKWLNQHVGNPFRDTGSGTWLEDKDLMATLRAKFDIAHGAGTFKQPCGYWPRLKFRDGQETGAPLTGEHWHEAGYHYVTNDEPTLYLYVWPRQDCKIRGGRLMWHANPEGD